MYYEFQNQDCCTTYERSDLYRYLSPTRSPDDRSSSDHVRTIKRQRNRCLCSDNFCTLTGKTKTGESIQFYANGEVTTEQKVTISSEKALWEGHHYVSWDKADGDPNKSFNLIPQEVMTALKPGTILRVYYSIEPTAEYHQMQLATGW